MKRINSDLSHETDYPELRFGSSLSRLPGDSSSNSLFLGSAADDKLIDTSSGYDEDFKIRSNSSTSRTYRNVIFMISFPDLDSNFLMFWNVFSIIGHVMKWWINFEIYVEHRLHYKHTLPNFVV